MAGKSLIEILKTLTKIIGKAGCFNFVQKQVFRHFSFHRIGDQSSFYVSIVHLYHHETAGILITIKFLSSPVPQNSKPAASQ
ncbi:MAG: hypothetical protein LBT09_09060 [Planctomycetaceae bacterium]|jgi:hypothetical protein|nr:hypothetical protein [Planctomycetaceae bacterium]